MRFCFPIAIVSLLIPFAALGAAPSAPPHLAQSLSELAPRANPKVLALATQALACVRRSQPAHTLSVIDYSLPSTQRRLWVFALGPTPRLLFVSGWRMGGTAVPIAPRTFPTSRAV